MTPPTTPAEPEPAAEPETATDPETDPAETTEPADNPMECPAAQPEDDGECEAPGGGDDLSCVYGAETCVCEGGFMGDSWNCEETPECPAETPEDGEDCDDFDGLTCGGCECGGGFGGPSWDCGGEETATEATEATEPEETEAPEGDAGGEPGDPGNPDQCPETAPADEGDCMPMGGGGGGLECSYGDSATVCTCEGGFMGGAWSCEAGEEEGTETAATEVECPDAPEDGDDCEDFDGMTCGGCECGGGFGGPTWDCGGASETNGESQTEGDADAGGFPF